MRKQKLMEDKINTMKMTNKMLEISVVILHLQEQIPKHKMAQQLTRWRKKNKKPQN